VTPWFFLIESLRQETDSGVIVFNPEQFCKAAPDNEIENALVSLGLDVVFLVETGESRTPRPKELVQDLLQA